MLRQHLILLLVTAGVISDVSGSLENNIEIIIDSLNTKDDAQFLNLLYQLNINFQVYDFNIDTSIPWKELELAMKVLNYIRLFPKFRCASMDLDEMQCTIDHLINEYRQSTEKMFKWAVMAREKFNLTVQYKDNLKNITRIKNYTDDILNAGQLIINQTVCKLNRIIRSLIGLKDKLKKLKNTLERNADSNMRTFNVISNAVEDAITKVIACLENIGKNHLGMCMFL